MTSTFEDTHPRAEKRGTFVDRGFSFPEVNLGFFEDVSGKDHGLTDFADGAPIITMRPGSVAEAHDALDSEYLDQPGTVRHVLISDAMAVLSDEDVYGPEDGRPLLVEITVGAGSLRVHSGHVIVKVDSPFPNDVEVLGDAQVTVIVSRGRSSVVRAAGTSNVLVIAEEGARGVLRVESADATGVIIGSATHFRIAATHSWEI